MSKLIDELGNRYDKLLVVKRTKNHNTKAMWLCKCDCGGEVVTLGHSLRSGSTKSCGCLRMKPPGEAAFNALFLKYKSSAKFRKLDWSLSKLQFRELTKRSCQFCGIDPSTEYCAHRTKKGNPTGNGVYVCNGIDRLDSLLGYTIENSVPCCTKCNYAKRSMSFDEFVSWIKSVYTHLVGDN